MRDFRDAKAMAQTLRESLKTKSVDLTHAESLELIAKTLGFHDWNVLAARIQSERHSADDAWTPAAAALLPLPGSTSVPVLPLRDIVLFPHAVGPVFIGRDKSKRAVEHARASNVRILVVTQRRSYDDDPQPDALYGTGVTARVIQHLPLGDGSVKLLVQGLERVEILRFIEGEFWSAEIAAIEEQRGRTTEASTLVSAVLEAYKVYANIDPSAPPQALVPLTHVTDPSAIADAIAHLLSIGIERRQELLETLDVVARLERILELMKAGRQAA
jgi:ATP-dependent Lon protease